MGLSTPALVRKCSGVTGSSSPGPGHCGRVEAGGNRFWSSLRKDPWRKGTSAPFRLGRLGCFVVQNGPYPASGRCHSRSRQGFRCTCRSLGARGLPWSVGRAGAVWSACPLAWLLPLLGGSPRLWVLDTGVPLAVCLPPTMDLVGSALHFDAKGGLACGEGGRVSEAACPAVPGRP